MQIQIVLHTVDPTKRVRWCFGWMKIQTDIVLSTMTIATV